MSTKALVHVIDDDEAVRDSVAFLFDSADLPARTYESATVFLETVDEVRSGCVVTDVRMPEMSGLDLLRELKARGFAPPVIVITGHGDVPLALEAVRAGAFDFLEKPFDDELLLDSVRRAMAQPSGEPDSDERARARANLQRLSDDERQVLKGLVAGELNRAIADGLGVSTRTVDVYRAKLMAKMEAGAFADLVRMALLAEDAEN
jgi:two-component system, LuxR family, response regulator FixJ